MNEALIQIILNILSSFLYFLLGAAGAYVFGRLRKWSKTRLFSQIYNDKTLVVALTTRDEGPYQRSTPRVSLAEVDAIINLKSLIGTRMRFELLKYPNETSLFNDKNILSVGGTLANHTSELAFEKIKNKLPFDYIMDDPPRIEIGSRVYTPKYSEDRTVVLRDYAVIVKTSNPFMESEIKDKKLFLLMGLHGYGTRGAALALMDAKISKSIWNRIKTGGFCAVIRVEIDQDRRLEVFLEEVWELC